MEDEGLVDVAHHQHLARPAVGAIEAVGLGERAHQLDRVARAAHALGGDARELVDREERLAARRPHRARRLPERRRRRRLAEAQLALVLHRVVAVEVRVRVRHLRDRADRRRRRLAVGRQVRRAARVADEPRPVLDVGPDRPHAARCMVGRRHVADARVGGAGAVVAVRDHHRAVGRRVLARGVRRARGGRVGAHEEQERDVALHFIALVGEGRSLFTANFSPNFTAARLARRTRPCST